jgi:hypothetical protein
MQVFKPSDSLHSLFFIPRIEATTVILKITNELRSTETFLNVFGTMINGTFNGFFTYDFKEGGSYEIEITNNDSRLLYRGKAFATDVEDLQNYKLIR